MAGAEDGHETRTGKSYFAHGDDAGHGAWNRHGTGERQGAKDKHRDRDRYMGGQCIWLGLRNRMGWAVDKTGNMCI